MASIWTINAFGEVFHVRAFPSRPFRAVKIYDNNGITAINEKGQFFSSRVAGRRFFSGAHLNQNALAILEGIAGLGAFPLAKAKALTAERERHRKAELDGWAAEQIKIHAEEIGLPLTAAQKRKITTLIAASK